MPKAEIDTSIYPKNLRMSHGHDEEREWWEWKNKRQGRSVVIQCLPSRKHGWAVYFVNGAELGMLREDGECRKGIGGPGENGLQACLDGLGRLGFIVQLGQGIS